MGCATDIIFGQVERISIIFPSIGLGRCPRSHFSTPFKRFTVSNVQKRAFKWTSATDAKSQKMMTRFQNQKCLNACHAGYLVTTQWQTRLIIRIADNLQCFTKYVGKIYKYACGNAMKVFKIATHIQKSLFCFFKWWSFGFFSWFKAFWQTISLSFFNAR